MIEELIEGIKSAFIFVVVMFFFAIILGGFFALATLVLDQFVNFWNGITL
tara:strand:- start:268 stop:417 length:150 start_codon:yes stop_codon:yes gene_type:complete